MPLCFDNRILSASGNLQLFRRLKFGNLADLHVLDTRQFRTDQPAADGFGSTDPDSLALGGVFGEKIFDANGILDPDATMMGGAAGALAGRGPAVDMSPSRTRRSNASSGTGPKPAMMVLSPRQQVVERVKEAWEQRYPPGESHDGRCVI
jgi:hypothetical protein